MSIIFPVVLDLYWSVKTVQKIKILFGLQQLNMSCKCDNEKQNQQMVEVVEIFVFDQIVFSLNGHQFRLQ